MMQNKFYFFVFTFLIIASTCIAQQIILDNPIKAGDLTVFPDLNNQNQYYYISDQARLALNENGKPQFSFLRYIDGSESPNSTGIAEAGGGGIVHAVITLGVSDEQLDEARRELRQLNSKGIIKGPVIFKSGNFALVSSFTTENGELSSQVIGIGKAPILDGQKAAISILLTKLGSQLLWESFKTNTPDISFSFEMTLGGFRLPKRAKIIANFDEIYQSFDLGVQAGYSFINNPVLAGNDSIATNGSEKENGSNRESSKSETTSDSESTAKTGKARSGNNFYLGAEIQYVFEELRKTGAITVEQIGDDEDISKLVQTAYNKMADMMFDQVQTSASNQPNLGDVLNQLGQGRRIQQEQEKLHGVMVSFKMKEKRKTGQFEFNLNKWTNDEIVMRFDEPIGDITQYENDESMFRIVNTEDPAYDQREIVSLIDGYNADDFGEYINFVSIHLQKKHAKGYITDKEIIINRDNFNQQGNNFSMSYGWHGDNNRNNWMKYQYEILWSFFGDVEVTESFQESTFNAINLAPPYQKYQVEIEADPNLLEDQGVRIVTVNLYYKVEGKEFTKQSTLIPHRERLSDIIEYLSTSNNQGYEYEISWRLKGNKVIESGRRKGSDSFLFVDELPN